jgi:(2R)-3-sulfolactate dehydrogenase (NADP+)
MVEVLSAGISGANWSLDAPSFTTGSQSPGTGLTVIALATRLVDRGFETRLAAQLDRLSGHGVHIPGRSKGAAHGKAETGGLSIPRALHQRISGARQ